MPLYLKDDKLLVRDGDLAVSAECCCTETECLEEDLSGVSCWHPDTVCSLTATPTFTYTGDPADYEDGEWAFLEASNGTIPTGPMQFAYQDAFGYTAGVQANGKFNASWVTVGNEFTFTDGDGNTETGRISVVVTWGAGQGGAGVAWDIWPQIKGGNPDFPDDYADSTNSPADNIEADDNGTLSANFTWDYCGSSCETRDPFPSAPLQDGTVSGTFTASISNNPCCVEIGDPFEGTATTCYDGAATCSDGSCQAEAP